MSHPHNVVLGKSRYNKTKKWMRIFPLLKTLSSKDDNANHDDGDSGDAFQDSFQHVSCLNKNNDGDGIPSWEQVITHSKSNCIDSRQTLTKEKDSEKRIQGD